MTRILSTYTLTVLLVASLAAPMTASADHHTLIDRVKPAGKLVIKESTAAPAPAKTEQTTPQAEIPGGGPTSNAAPAQPAAVTTASANIGKKLFETKCSACHAAGVAGAPKFGNKDDWAPRIAKGIDALMVTVLNGKGAMPPKGTCMECSDDQLKAAAQYMVNAAQ